MSSLGIDVMNHPVVVAAQVEARVLVWGWVECHPHGVTDQANDSPESIKERECLADHLAGWPGIDLVARIADALLAAKGFPLDDLVDAVHESWSTREPLSGVFARFVLPESLS